MQTPSLTESNEQKKKNMSIDPLNLNINTNEVSTSFPVLPAGSYVFEVKQASAEAAKQPGNYNLVVGFALAQEAVLADGNTVNPGFPLTRWYPLQQSENPKAPPFMRDICVLLDAAFGTTQDNRPPLNNETLAALTGRQVRASIIVKNDPTYGMTNEIGRLSAV
jgi:hypothetical protein